MFPGNTQILYFNLKTKEYSVRERDEFVPKGFVWHDTVLYASDNTALGAINQYFAIAEHPDYPELGYSLLAIRNIPKNAFMIYEGKKSKLRRGHNEGESSLYSILVEGGQNTLINAEREGGWARFMAHLEESVEAVDKRYLRLPDCQSVATSNFEAITRREDGKPPYVTLQCTRHITASRENPAMVGFDYTFVYWASLSSVTQKYTAPRLFERNGAPVPPEDCFHEPSNHSIIRVSSEILIDVTLDRNPLYTICRNSSVTSDPVLTWERLRDYYGLKDVALARFIMDAEGITIEHPTTNAQRRVKIDPEIADLFDVTNNSLISGVPNKKSIQENVKNLESFLDVFFEFSECNPPLLLSVIEILQDMRLLEGTPKEQIQKFSGFVNFIMEGLVSCMLEVANSQEEKLKKFLRESAALFLNIARSRISSDMPDLFKAKALMDLPADFPERGRESTLIDLSMPSTWESVVDLPSNTIVSALPFQLPSLSNGGTALLWSAKSSGSQDFAPSRF